MFDCKFCGRYFKTKRSIISHKRFCKNFIIFKQKQLNTFNFICVSCEKRFKTQNSLRGHKTKCKKFQIQKELLLTKDFLYENLIQNGFSANFIAKKVLKDFTAGNIIRQAHKYGIKTYSSKEAAKLKIVRNNYKNTCLKKYNSVNVFCKNSKGYKTRNRNVKEKVKKHV